MNDFEIISESGWFITPDGDLINFDRVERIRIADEKVFISTTGSIFTYPLNAEWKKFLRALPEKLHANVIN